MPVKTGEAAFALMERLVCLRDQSAKAAEATLSSEAKTDDQADISVLAGEALSTIASVRVALSETKKHDWDVSKGLHALGADIKSGIEAITERSRLTAFNMAIEAARLGEKGRGFKVIVGALRFLNDRTADFSKQVAELLGGFKKYNESLVQASIDSSSKIAFGKLVRVLQKPQIIEGVLATIADAERDIAPITIVDSSPAATAEERRSVEALRRELLAREEERRERSDKGEISA